MTQLCHSFDLHECLLEWWWSGSTNLRSPGRRQHLGRPGLLLQSPGAPEHDTIEQWWSNLPVDFKDIEEMLFERTPPKLFTDVE